MSNSTTKRPFFTSKSSVDVNQLIAQDGWQCRYCGRFLTADMMTVDHVLPTSRGGSDTPSNVVLCCRECNAQKGDMNLEEYTHYMNVRQLAENMNGKPTNVLYELSVPGFASKTVCYFPARAAGSHLLKPEERKIWDGKYSVSVNISTGVSSDTVVFLRGPLFDYYRMKHQL